MIEGSLSSCEGIEVREIQLEPGHIDTGILSKGETL